MDFSVIIPTFNRRELLRRTVESVISQVGTEFEIIVIDDGSTDGTLEMLRTSAPRVRTLTQTNRGPGAARNLGMQNASGDYIAFLDSDDLWFSWTLNTYRAVIQQCGRPAFIAGRPFRFSDESQLSAAREEELKLESFADYFASGDQWRWWGASSFVIRRDALQTVGGFTFDLNNGEDADLAMRLGTSPGFVQVQSPATFAYREHAGTLTGVIEQRYRAACKWIDRELSGEYPGGAARQYERRRILSRHIRPTPLALVDAGQAGRGWEIYRRIWKWNLAERRIRYLLALPVKILSRLLTGSNKHA
jgi:cellulose synthase/poly-beta-1,6-N-acetylglucosamine synthase-like glycosyltransferase